MYTGELIALRIFCLRVAQTYSTRINNKLNFKTNLLLAKS